MPDEAARITSLRFRLLDAVEPAFARELVARVSRRLAIPCLLGGRTDDLPARWIEGRNQLDALALLQSLEAAGGEEGAARIGLTTRDIALPVFTHVFGVARHRGRDAVVSLARLRPEFYGMPADPEVTVRRATRESMHELGHVFGLEHCRDFACVMHFAPDVESIDVRGAGYCPDCRGRVPAGLVHIRDSASPA